jgi:hypothetical protein
MTRTSSRSNFQHLLSTLVLLSVVASTFALYAIPPRAHAETVTYSTPGSLEFEVPAYETLTVRVWGGGAGAYGWPENTAEDGEQSSFDSSVIANGGTASSTASAPGGTASGGGTNTTGGDGETYTSAPSPGDFSGGEGGDSPNGGTGGLSGTSGGDAGSNGNAPGGGGGGGGYTVQCFSVDSVGTLPGGGAGGYSEKSYSPGDLTPGSSVPVVVGAGGSGAEGADQSSDFCSPIIYGEGGDGADGRVEITYTPAATQTEPDAPANLVTTSTVAAVLLNWTAPESSGDSNLETYGVWRHTSPFSATSSATLIASIATTSTSYTDSTAVHGIAYYYGVTAVNAEGESDFSNQRASGSNSGRIIRLKGAVRLRGGVHLR